MKRLLIPALLALCLVALPAFSQQFPPKGDDITTSLGSFRIEVTNPNFANLFNGCPGYDSTKKIFQSPTLFDPATRIGRSDPILDDSAADQNGLPVGNDNTLVPESALMPPGSFGFGSGTREVHTEVRALKMTGSGMMVRGGVWYNDPNNQTPPSRISPGEVESHSRPGGQPADVRPLEIQWHDQHPTRRPVPHDVSESAPRPYTHIARDPQHNCAAARRHRRT